MTGFALEDKHKISCSECHRKEKTFLGLSRECLGCHADVHQKTLTECLKCHTFKGWKSIQFNHDGSPNFKLTGKHREVTCGSCHPEQILPSKSIKADKVNKVLKFKPLKSEKCNDCHNDLHKDLKDKACESCHSTKGWKEQTFDHNNSRLSDFKLEGSHAKVSCELCHPVEKTTVKTDGKEVEKSVRKLKPIKHTLCNECHFDVHNGQFKDRKCDSCHTVQEKWKNITFKHEAVEYKGFKLEGKHKEVSCEKCHQKSETPFKEFNKNKTVSTGKFKPLKSEKCNDCHFDVHREQFKDQTCDACHTVQEKWKGFTFKHNASAYRGFKLDGKHKDVVCEKCHARSEINFEEFGNQKQVSVGTFKPIGYTTCISCHEDKHNGKFEKACEKCHIPDSWEPRKFLHDPLTSDLKGVHNTLSCGACHKQSKDYKGLDSNCLSCHNDVHFNQFGRFCGDCHRQQAWIPPDFNHTGVGFQLVGGHRKADCTDCHKNRSYRNTPSDCYVCHQTDYQSAPEHVTSSYPHDCTECHKISGTWQQVSHDHISFTFQGAHAALKGDCSKCHLSFSVIPFGTTDHDCYNCHATAGVATTKYEGATSPSHVTNNFSRTCTDCHTNIAWIPAKYTHRILQYSGVHSTLTCSKCHTNGYPGAYAGVSQDNCYACHAGNYQAAPGHVSTGYPHDCTACHSTTGTWANVRAYTHTTFTFTGAHTAIRTTCTECHITGKTIPAGTGDSDCYNCHATAGVATTKYEGVTSPSHVTNNFSRTCMDCHTNTAWIPARYTHRSFQYSGVHSTLTCNKCHTNGYPGAYAGVSQDNCYACHAGNYQAAPSHVSRSYPHDCTGCHSINSWSGATLHQSFQFIGKHGSLSCESCHMTGYPGQYAGATENDCYRCHANNYAGEHSTCSHECTLCHSVSTWSNPKSKNGCN